MITHVSISNYKSLAHVDVDLGPLTVLVGQNGVGKSNFVDVFRFTSDLLTLGLGEAFQPASQGIKSFFSADTNHELEIGFKFNIDNIDGEYSFALPYHSLLADHVLYEKAIMAGQGYELRGGMLTEIPGGKQREFVGQGALFLPLVAKTFSVAPLYDFLINSARYHILPGEMRNAVSLSSGSKLNEYGSNIGTVLRRIKESSGEDFERIISRINQIVPDITGLDVVSAVSYDLISVRHEFLNGASIEAALSAESDGTLRVLGILAALYQYPSLRLLTLEEPELMIHPGAFGVLGDIIKEASLRSQIIITTHSPDLISEFSPDQIRVVEKVDGATRISPLDDGQMEAVRQKLFSTGELMLIEGLRGQPQS